MSLIEQYFRCNVFWCATYGICPFLNNFSKSEVNKFKKTIVSNHDVFRLKISITDIFIVQILKNGCDLSSIKSIIIIYKKIKKGEGRRSLEVGYLHCLFHIEVSNRAVVSEEITASEKFSEKIDVSVILQKAVIL